MHAKRITKRIMVTNACKDKHKALWHMLEDYAKEPYKKGVYKLELVHGTDEFMKVVGMTKQKLIPSDHMICTKEELPAFRELMRFKLNIPKTSDFVNGSVCTITSFVVDLGISNVM